MKKQNALTLIMSLIFLVIFNVVFFIAGGIDRPASVWISYLFIHIAYVMVFLTPYLAPSGSSRALFVNTTGAISTMYFVVEFVVGLIFIFVAPEGFKAALIIQLIIAGIYLFILLGNMKADIATSESQAVAQAESAFIHEAAGKLKLMVDRFDDKETNRMIERAYDMVRTSPTRTSPQVSNLEMELGKSIAALGGAVSTQNAEEAARISKGIIGIMEERNRLL